MQTALLIIGTWTLLEGGFSLLFPQQAIRLASLFSRNLAQYLSAQSLEDIRKLGGIECLFGAGVLALRFLGPA